MDESLLASKGIHPTESTIGYVDGFGLHIGKRATLLPGENCRTYGVLMKINSEDAAALLVLAREMIALNGGFENLKIRHIQAGQFIELPDMESGEQLSIDAKTLFIYESSSHYEHIVRTRIDEAYRRIGGDWKAEVINDDI